MNQLMKIGYARVSTNQQQDSLEIQQQALKAYGCEKYLQTKSQEPGQTARASLLKGALAAVHLSSPKTNSKLPSV